MDPNSQNVEEYNGKCLQIVQKYIEIVDPHDENSIKDFLEDCHYITRAYFEDIIEERACSDLCGYVLCNNLLTETTRKQFKIGQKYHIQRNQVYDITRRKNFCSNHCFQSSEFLRSQICTEPLFLRKNDQSINNLKLYQDETNDQFGDVIQLVDPLTNNVESKRKSNETKRMNTAQQSIRNHILKNERSVENKLSAPYLKEEELHELKQKFQEFTIHENQIIDGDHEDSIKLISENNEYGVLQDQEADFKYEIDNVFVKSSGSSKARKSKKPKHFPSGLLRQMSEWVTVDSRNFLGINQPEDTASNLPPELSAEDEQKKLERYRWEYIRLCAKLNEEELEDEKYDQIVLKEHEKTGKNQKTKTKSKSVLKESKSSTTQMNADKIMDNQQELSAFLTENQSFESDSKKVRFNEVVEENKSGEIAQTSIQDQHPVSDQLSEALITPLNDNQHCDIKRRKSFLSILQKNLEEIFEDQFNIHEISDVLEQIKLLVNSFHLNSQNTDLSWKNHHLVTIVLLRTLLIFNKIDSSRYKIILESNLMIKTIMELFDLTLDALDELIKKIFAGD